MFPSVVLWAFRTGLSKTLGSHSPYNGIMIHLCYWDHKSTFTPNARGPASTHLTRNPEPKLLSLSPKVSKW